MLRQGLSLGALTLLSGCNLGDGDAVDRVLWAMSRWNDRVQAAFSARTDWRRLIPRARSRSRFRSTPITHEVEVPDGGHGRVAGWSSPGSSPTSAPWTLDQLRALPQASQITRHVCVEGWSAIGQWGGVRSATSSSAWARTRARIMSGSGALTTTTPA